jgi:hypothetical protein
VRQRHLHERRRCRVIAAAFAILLVDVVLPAAAVAQTDSNGSASLVPPKPLAKTDQSVQAGTPEDALARASARVTIQAFRLREGLAFDGRLDDAVYRRETPVSEFIQQVPHEGALASEKTDAWVFFDRDAVYVSARCWDSTPPETWVANEMRRDGSQLAQNDSFGVLLDTFGDGHDGVFFSTNPLGALQDQQITEERTANADWDPVWDVKTSRFPGGWTVEMRIPFKSLRYRPGAAQTWGIQLRRVVRRLSEWSFISPVPISAAGRDGASGILRVSAAATLTGLEVPSGARNIELKPFALGKMTTDRAASPAFENHSDASFGFDAKYGITQNLTADFTYNTDFAQVEADQQQVNLTRFSLLFPEKRQFFLEGKGIFDFGRTGGSVPLLFFSRRIGLEDGHEVPIVAGGRMTGRVGRYSVGAINIQTDGVEDVASTNFTVLRVKRNIFRRSAIGALYTGRSVSTLGDGGNHAFGADARLSFRENVNVNLYLARTSDPALHGRDSSYQAQFDYPADVYGLRVEQVVVERNFHPDVGFVSRSNFSRSFGEVRYSPRPKSLPSVRQFTFEASLDYTRTADTGQLETREQLVSFESEFRDSGRFELDVVDVHERLDEAFDIADGISIPPGSYDSRHVEIVYTVARQRPVNGSVLFRGGTFYGGDVRTIEVTGARIKATPKLSIEPSLSFSDVDLPYGSFRTSVTRARATYTLTPRMFVSGLVQFNSESDRVSTNVRMRWEYRPGSELFVVYSEDRDTFDGGLRQPRNRGVAIKMNRLFRY